MDSKSARLASPPKRVSLNPDGSSIFRLKTWNKQYINPVQEQLHAPRSIYNSNKNKIHKT